MSDYFPAYEVLKEAWYATQTNAFDDQAPQINIQLAHPDGGVKWEFGIVERPEIQKNAYQVRVFDDAFEAFSDIPDFFTALALARPQTLDQVRLILDHQGFKDITKRSGT